MKLSDQITRRHLFVAFGTSSQTGTLSSVDLAAVRDNASVSLTASDGSVAPIAGADASTAGVMTAADKTKLEGLPPTTTREFGALSEVPGAIVGDAITHLRTAGHSNAGDGGGALYKRVGTEPSHNFKVQSADGAWWEGVPHYGVVNVGQFGATLDGAANDGAAFQAAEDYQKPFVVNGTSLIGTTVTGDRYLTIEGIGDSEPVNVTALTGIDYTYPGSGGFDDHLRKEVRRMRLRGDASPSDFTGGTATLLKLSGSYSNHQEMTYELGNVGARIIKYACDGYKNHYRANSTYGLHLDGVTAYTEREIYARGQHNTTGAAVFISGANTENIRLSGGAIEGNRAPAIKVDSTGFLADAFSLDVDHVYFELDGDNAAGVPSIDIPSDMGDGARVTFNGCKLSRNVSTWTSGPYKLGKNAIFRGTRLSGDVSVENASLLEGTRLGDLQLNYGAEPVLVHEFAHVSWDAGRNGSGGHAFAAAVTGKPTWASPVPNAAPTAHSYLTASSTNPPTISANSTDDYGDGDWTRAVFNASAGAFGNNAVRIGNFLDAANGFRVHVFLIKATATTTLQMTETGMGGSLSHRMQLVGGKTYKLVCLTNRTLSSGNNALYAWPQNGDGPTIDVISLYQAQFTDQWQASAFVSQMVNS